MTDTKKKRRVATNLGILLLATLGSTGVAEIVVRTLYQDTVLYPRYHTDARYGRFILRKLRPNSEFWHTSKDGSWRFVTNSQGFRNYRDFDYEKPTGTIRVLSLGDSQTLGFEVRQDHTFSSVIERYLQRKNYRAEVINAGVSGFSTAEELLFLENEGIKYRPDIVVLGFFLNDFEDNVKAGLFELGEQDNLLLVKEQHIPGVQIQNFIYAIPGVKWLSENSYLYSLVFNSVWNFFKIRLAQKSANQVLEYAIVTESKFSDYQINLASKLIMRMYEVCKKYQAKLVIVDIPYFGNTNKLISSVPSSLIRTIVASSDAYIDTTSMLSDYAGVIELHIPHGQRHISEFTHAVIGVAVGTKIETLMKERPWASSASE